jgi:hypothetical protein
VPLLAHFTNTMHVLSIIIANTAALCAFYLSVRLTNTMHVLLIRISEHRVSLRFVSQHMTTRTKYIKQSPLEAPHAHLVKAFLNCCEIRSSITLSQAPATDDTMIT